MDATNIVRDQLINALSGRQAHISFEEAVKNMRAETLVRKPENTPYNIWSLAEHIRITQWDIVEFCRNPAHQSPEWPDGYWPAPGHPGPGLWRQTLENYRRDLNDMIEMVRDPESDLFTPFAHGSGQNLLREGILIIDHTSYHTGQIITIRRQLGDWKI